MCWRERGGGRGVKKKNPWAGIGRWRQGGFNNVTSYQRLLSHRRWQFHVAWRWFQGGRGGRNGQVNWIENKRCQRHVFIIQTALIAVARRLEQQPHLNRIRGQNMQKIFKHTWKTRSSHQAAGVWHTGSENGCQWNAKPLTTHHLWLKIFPFSFFLSLYSAPALSFLLTNGQSCVQNNSSHFTLTLNGCTCSRIPHWQLLMIRRRDGIPWGQRQTLPLLCAHVKVSPARRLNGRRETPDLKKIHSKSILFFLFF